jgi:FRG domain
VETVTPAWSSTELSSIDAIHQAARQHTRRWMFRGQACRSWKLQSTLGRLAASGMDAAVIARQEQRAITEFRRLATTGTRLSATERILVQSDNNSAALLMRHYGVPTRALDWTSSFWVAAYFACAERSACDAAIWSVDREMQEVAAREHPSHRFFLTAGGDFDGDRLFLPDAPDHIIFVHVTALARFDRVRAQEGLFSVSSRLEHDHATAFSRYMPPECLPSWVIPAHLKVAVIEACERQGVGYQTLYPGLTGIARAAGRLFDVTPSERCRACSQQ